MCLERHHQIFRQTNIVILVFHTTHRDILHASVLLILQSGNNSQYGSIRSTGLRQDFLSMIILPITAEPPPRRARLLACESPVGDPAADGHNPSNPSRKSATRNPCHNPAKKAVGKTKDLPTVTYKDPDQRISITVCSEM